LGYLIIRDAQEKKDLGVTRKVMENGSRKDPKKEEKDEI